MTYNAKVSLDCKVLDQYGAHIRQFVKHMGKIFQPKYL